MEDFLCLLLSLQYHSKPHKFFGNFSPNLEAHLPHSDRYNVSIYAQHH